jgi:maltose/moltooligosaccharide transporter
MALKPKLSFWQIWNMSFGFLGIQFGFALQNANVSRIFQSLGADIDAIPILWVAAPITGLIVQPIIGHLSDKTWGRLGRRRPYFLTGAIMASLALFLMPNSPVLWIAAGMLWIMDASINISMEPFRAFVGDMLDEEQRTSGFAMQSFFIGTGAVIASLLPYIMTNWIGISNTPAGDQVIPDSVKYSFYIGGVAFFGAVLWTVISSREYTPEKLASFDKIKTGSLDNPDIQAGPARKDIRYFRNGSIWTLLGLTASYMVYDNQFDLQLYILSIGAVVFGIIQLVTGLMLSKSVKSGLTEVIEDLFHMPKTMGQLAFVQFFTWFALFAMWIYTTAAVTSHVYGTSDTTSPAYNEGANWVGVLMGVYNGVAAVIAFLLPVIARKTSRKTTHFIALCFGGIGMASFFIIRDPLILMISEIGIGFAWASILSMPYAILTGALPSRKMGVYMGIFNFFIVIPQILAASLLGFLVRNIFNDQAVLALVLGGLSMIIAAILTLFVSDPASKS